MTRDVMQRDRPRAGNPAVERERFPPEWALGYYRRSPQVVRQMAYWTLRNAPGLRVSWGNMKRVRPFSDRYGWDRGLPVDRHYIEQWISRHANDIRGHVLEVKNAEYSSRFGTPGRITIIDRDKTNHHADLHVDLDVADSLPAAEFDCVILTQVLQYTSPGCCLENLWRSLRPNGVLLISVPALGRIDVDDGADDKWRWTPPGLRAELARVGIEATVEGFGNVLAGVSALLGLAVGDVSRKDLDVQDARFPVLTCGRAEKPR
ncbi:MULTISPECIES: class I SAM-dependent methyltransferase [unclassified Frankia]|uniref:class I SAM-dependent methyltransferase n=1 Tax=unclassified Frankia TaxID=2632575 RepID=UPI000D58C61A|nr:MULTISPECIES: class I SAM-dependent methyltransferase [unclassified Frankia]